MSEIFSPNDWREYLMHASKWDWSNGNSSAYNHDYYLRNRAKHLARMKELYALKGKVRRLGNKTGSASSAGEESSSKKSSGSSKKSSSSSKAAESTSSKIELDENAPEWLKNYAAEIEKVRQSTGNANWVPAHVNDFSAWKAELEKNYPNLNLSGDAAKEVWNTIHDKFGGTSSTTTSSSSKKSSSSDGKGEVTKTHTNVTDKTDRDKKEETSTQTNVTKEHRLEDLEERAKELEDNRKSVQEEIEEEKKRRRSSSRRETK